MTRTEAISEWTFRSDHIKEWLEEYGEEPSIRHYVELIDMAIEALQREEAEEKGWCHRIRPKGEMREPTEEERASVKRYIDSISADVVAVVRCKDCRHRYEEGDCTHYYWCRINDRPIDDTDFCAWGELKGGEDE